MEAATSTSIMLQIQLLEATKRKLGQFTESSARWCQDRGRWYQQGKEQEEAKNRWFKEARKGDDLKTQLGRAGAFKARFGLFEYR